MRTTVTLDPDVDQLLKQAMEEKGISFKEALNGAVRNGLTRPGGKRRFVQKTASLGAEQYFRWDKALAVAAAMEDDELVRKLALPWTVVLGFLRLTTRPGLFAKPLPPEQAFDLLEEWLNQPSVVVLEPSVRHLGLLREILLELGTAGNLTADAHLAAIAMAHRAELCSTDSDFGRIAGLRWRDPLRARK
jgi:toxin-antitoxin system PIN domain toxin